MINPFTGLKILTSTHAYQLVVTDERLFPASRHRSRRIHKKLLKRYGGEYKVIRKPVAYKIDEHTLVVHPSLYEELKKKSCC